MNPDVPIRPVIRETMQLAPQDMVLKGAPVQIFFLSDSTD